MFNISHVSSVCHPEPSTYVEFSYNRPSNVISFQQMLMVPYTMPWNDRPRCFSLWFCVDKYPLQAQIHIFSAFTGRSYFQIWVCACSGDVTLRQVCAQTAGPLFFFHRAEKSKKSGRLVCVCVCMLINTSNFSASQNIFIIFFIFIFFKNLF